jgi:hypothetical protein
VIWLDAASYAIAAVLVAALVPRRASTPPAAVARGLLAGVRFVVRDRLLRPLVLEIAIVGMFIPLLFAAPPVLAFERYGRSALVAGALASAWSGGALVGAAGAYRAASSVSPLRLVAFAAPWFALPTWVLAFDVPAWAASVALGVCGPAAPFLNAPIFTLITTHTPPALRGKVMTTASTAEIATGPVGYALTGPAFAGLGLAGAYALVAAGLSSAMAFLMWVVRRPSAPVTAGDVGRDGRDGSRKSLVELGRADR